MSYIHKKYMKKNRKNEKERQKKKDQNGVPETDPIMELETVDTNKTNDYLSSISKEYRN